MLEQELCKNAIIYRKQIAFMPMVVLTQKNEPMSNSKCHSQSKLLRQGLEHVRRGEKKNDNRQESRNGSIQHGGPNIGQRLKNTLILVIPGLGHETSSMRSIVIMERTKVSYLELNRI
jgi:hypothetical protein